jgi:putative transposase
VCSRTGRPLGRPWLTLLIDAFSRRILAFALLYDPPSYRSCMMVVRACVQRYERLPQILVVDGGREFQSTYFETLLARYECSQKTRPPAKARFGAVCERLFGTTNTQFIYNLRGNTQLSRESRHLTKAVDPKSQAVWSLEELSRCLAQYLYDIYDTADHPALGQSPRTQYDDGLTRTGLRPQRHIAYDEQFRLFTLPTTPRGQAKIIPGRGVKVRYLYYWSELFRDPQVAGRTVEVRYDPFDAGTVYTCVRGSWTECHSEYYPVFQGRTEREIMLATTELYRRHRTHAAGVAVTGRRLAEFLQSVEAEESLLLQRLRDREHRAVGAASTRLTDNDDPGDAPPVQAPTLEPLASSADEDPKSDVYGEF